MVTMDLQIFLLLGPVRKAVVKLTNPEQLTIQVRIVGFDDKIMFTKHDLTGQHSSRGFRIEKITDTVFVIVPPSLVILQN